MILYKKRKKYKYNLHADYEYSTGLSVPGPADLGLLAIDGDGKLTIRKGYSWDGASGPTIDTKSFMRGSLIHDALYQLMREGVLPGDLRKKADQILRDECIKDGMSKVYAGCVYWSVRTCGAGFAKPDLLSAP